MTPLTTFAGEAAPKPGKWVCQGRALRVTKSDKSVILEITDLHDPQNVMRLFFDAQTAMSFGEYVQQAGHEVGA